MKLNYFLRFNPIFKDRIWGGEKLKNFLNKNTTSKTTGESWEISDVSEVTSIIKNGTLKGQSLKELLTTYTTDLVGEKVYQQFGNKFPLLVKFIDAKKALSIQLHPHDDLAKKRHNSFGKTEMWYVMQADENANLIVGFQKEVTKNEYLQHLKNKSLLDILNVDKAKKGDVYFIPTGLVHAIGSGVLLAEIQQTSDITYRLYDWDRPNPDGTYRKLHTDLALDAIDYSAKENYKTEYKSELNTASEIISCPYFTTNMLPVNGEVKINHSQKDSFVIYMCVKGSVIFTRQETSEVLQMGQTLLVPACLKEFTITADEDSELLEVYIK